MLITMSSLEGVVIAVKEHIGTKMKDDIRAVLQGIRFIDINVCPTSIILF